MKLIIFVGLLVVLLFDLLLARAGLRSPIVDTISVPGSAISIFVVFLTVLILLFRSTHRLPVKLFGFVAFCAVFFFAERIIESVGLQISRHTSDGILRQAISNSWSIQFSEKLLPSEIDKIKHTKFDEWRIMFCNPLWKHYDYVHIADGGRALGIRVTLPHGFTKAGSAWAYHETTFDAEYMAPGKQTPVGNCGQ